MFFVSGRYYFYCLILEKLKVRYVNSKKFFLQVQTNSKCFLQIDFARAYIIKLSHLGHYVNIPKSIATPKIILASISFITFKYFLFVLKKRGTYSLSLSLAFFILFSLFISQNYRLFHTYHPQNLLFVSYTLPLKR